MPETRATLTPDPPLPDPPTDQRHAESRFAEPNIETREGEDPPLTPSLEGLRGQTNQTYDGETEPAQVAKFRNAARQYEQAGILWPPDPNEPSPATPPKLLILDPRSAYVGGDDLNLNLIGNHFTPNSVIVFNGGDEPTTMENEGLLTTIVKPGLVSQAVTVPVLVRTGSHETTPLNFAFIEPQPEPEPEVLQPEQSPARKDFEEKLEAHERKAQNVPPEEPKPENPQDPDRPEIPRQQPEEVPEPEEVVELNPEELKPEEERNLGPFQITRIDDHEDGIAIMVMDGDFEVGDEVVVEATGNTSINGSYVVLDVGGLTIVVDNNVTLDTPIEGKGRLTVVE